MIKKLPIAIIALVTYSTSYASECDWSTSYKESEVIAEFETAGVLRGYEYNYSELTLDTFPMSANTAMKLTGKEDGRFNYEEHLDHLKAKIVKTTEHGSCYNGGVILSVQVAYGEDVLINEFSVVYPDVKN